jgi:hypothetical protein
VIASCKFDGVPPEFTPQRIGDALSNLYIDETAGSVARHSHSMAAE